MFFFMKLSAVSAIIHAGFTFAVPAGDSKKDFNIDARNDLSRKHIDPRETESWRLSDSNDAEYNPCIANTECADRKRDTASLAALAPATGPPDNCGKGGDCDCSGLDKNSEEYFQCVTNAACEHCWIGGRTSTTTIATRTSTTLSSVSSVMDVSTSTELLETFSTKTTSVATSESMSSQTSSHKTTDYVTEPPGTYTQTSNGTVIIIIVPPKTMTATSLPAVSTVSATSDSWVTETTSGTSISTTVTPSWLDVGRNATTMYRLH